MPGAKGHQVLGESGTYELRQPAAPYVYDFVPENGVSRLENTDF